VRFQSPTIASKYSSTWNALGTIIREERFFGLYKGITSPLVHAVPTPSSSLDLITPCLGERCAYEWTRVCFLSLLDEAAASTRRCGSYLVSDRLGRSWEWHYIVVSFDSFWCRFHFQTLHRRLITTPTELIKIRQQSLFTQTTARQVAWQIVREQGLRGLYRGLTATALRDTGYGAYFFAYEATCRFFSTPPVVDPTSTNIMTHVDETAGSLSWPALMLAGGVAGIGELISMDLTTRRLIAPPPILSWLGLHIPFRRGQDENPGQPTYLFSVNTPAI